MSKDKKQINDTLVSNLVNISKFSKKSSLKNSNNSTNYLSNNDNLGSHKEVQKESIDCPIKISAMSVGVTEKGFLKIVNPLTDGEDAQTKVASILTTFMDQMPVRVRYINPKKASKITKPRAKVKQDVEADSEDTDDSDKPKKVRKSPVRKPRETRSSNDPKTDAALVKCFSRNSAICHKALINCLRQVTPSIVMDDIYIKRSNSKSQVCSLHVPFTVFKQTAELQQIFEESGMKELGLEINITINSDRKLTKQDIFNLIW